MIIWETIDLAKRFCSVSLISLFNDAFWISEVIKVELEGMYE